MQFFGGFFFGGGGFLLPGTVNGPLFLQPFFLCSQEGSQKGFFFSPKTLMNNAISVTAGRALQKTNMYQYMVHSQRSDMKKDRATDALQWAPMETRLWVLLNMETPEKKPASSTAKRPRVAASAATSWMSCFSYSSGVNVRGKQAWMLLSRDQNKVMTTTRCARSVRKREGTSPEIRPMAPRGRGTAWSRGRGL